jgi:hypothetical protein
LRWLYLLFELAWAKVVGSPLRASRDKSVWYGGGTVALELVSLFHDTHEPLDFADVLAKIPNPSTRYSGIDGVAQASLYAIDILWTPKPDLQSATETEGKATDAPTLPAAPGEPQAAREQEEKDHQKRSSRLSHWAIGLAEKPGQWHLFQWFGNQQRWRERGLATVPQGRPAKLAEALGKNGGAISKADAIRLFRTDERRSWEPSKILESVCKRARMDLATATRKSLPRSTIGR